MRVFRENIVNHDNLIIVKEEQFKYNDFPFHSHPEYEIILILEGSGRRLVGDSITEFSPVDLCMFGSNLPHTFYTKGVSDDEAIKQIVIQFNENFLGPGFFERQLFQKIGTLLKRSGQGITFTGKTRQIVGIQIQDLVSKTSTEVIIDLLSILHTLSMSTEYSILSSPGFVNAINFDDSNRIGKVYDHILNNFRKDLTLEEVAAVAHLTPSAFCRYFRKFTRKTLSEFLNDVRVGYACKLLQKNNMSISQISIEAGFNSASYFNRKFKALKGKTPMEYQQHFITRIARDGDWALS